MARVTFVYRNNESLGIEYISAFIKKYGHQVCLVFDPGLFDTYYITNNMMNLIFNFKKITIDHIIATKPDLVAFSVVSDNYGWACEIAKHVKARLGVSIIFGGIHPTSVPHEVIKEDFIDFVCVGEGEYPLLELLTAIDNAESPSRINNLLLKKDGEIIINNISKPIDDLDSLPFADKDIFFNEYSGFINNSFMIVTSRGCPHSCSYCANSYLNNLYSEKASYVRRRSVHNVIKELKLAKNKYNMKRVTIFDDLFTYDKQWLREFSQEYKKYIDLPYFCCVSPATISGETAYLLKKSNCAVVSLGIQTLNTNIRREILCRYDENTQIAKAIAFLRKNRIYVYSNIILGLPGQSPDDLLKDAEFLNVNKPDINTIYWQRYYPATAIINKALSLSYLKKEDIVNINSGKSYAPYSLGGNTYNKDMARIGNLLLIVHVLPRILFKFIIKYRTYKIFPVKNYNFLLVILTGLFKKIFFRVKMTFFYLTPFEYLKFCLFYMNKKVTIVLRNKTIW